MGSSILRRLEQLHQSQLALSTAVASLAINQYVQRRLLAKEHPAAAEELLGPDARGQLKQILAGCGYPILVIETLLRELR